MIQSPYGWTGSVVQRLSATTYYPSWGTTMDKTLFVVLNCCPLTPGHYYGDCSTRGGVTQQPPSMVAGDAEARKRDQDPRCPTARGRRGTRAPPVRGLRP